MHAEDVGSLQFELGNDHGVGPLPSLHTRNVPVGALKRHLHQPAALSVARATRGKMKDSKTLLRGSLQKRAEDCLGLRA